MVVEGATDRTVFELYVERYLAPSLESGQVVIWDNLSVHRSAVARQAIEAVGCEVRFLPPYSPDFNPIELVFSKLKTGLRQQGARTRDALWDAIGEGLAAIRPQDVVSWYRHCGYQLTGQPL
jgi:transposase